jgi:hypothetical protein
MNRARGFVIAVLCPLRWPLLGYSQLLGVVFAVTPWLEQWGRRTQPPLSFTMSEQASAAIFAVLAALAGDEAVRRGGSVMRAFAIAVPCAALATAACHWAAIQSLGIADPLDPFASFINTFVHAAATWGPVILAYLNRRSAARLLMTLRQRELDRVQTERRLVASRLAVADAQIDPDALFGKLAQVRDLFACDDDRADSALEGLIDDLRATVARTR